MENIIIMLLSFNLLFQFTQTQTGVQKNRTYAWLECDQYTEVSKCCHNNYQSLINAVIPKVAKINALSADTFVERVNIRR